MELITATIPEGGFGLGKCSPPPGSSVTLNRKRSLSTCPTGEAPLLPIGREEGDFRPPPPHAQPSLSEIAAVPPMGSLHWTPGIPRLPLFPMKVGSSHALRLPVACHSGVYTRIRIPLLWRINLQECFKQSSSMQSQECCPNQGQH